MFIEDVHVAEREESEGGERVLQKQAVCVAAIPAADAEAKKASGRGGSDFGS